MKATVLTMFAPLLIGAGLGVLMARPARVAPQVKIEPGRKPVTPTPTPRKPIRNREPHPLSSLSGIWAIPITKRRRPPEIEMVLVPGGDFLMGSPENEPGRSAQDGQQHRVTIRSFYIGKYEVTQRQWRAVMGDNPSHFKGDDLPVENVSWNDAKEFCRRLSRMTSVEYRLPTEAEWEYACRAKTTGAYAGDLDAMAWYHKNSDSKTHPAGQKRPNAFGLYDMHGNVWEWCEDDWHRDYTGAPTDGAAWVDRPPKRGLYRVNRGGGWDSVADVCRSALRNISPADSRYYTGGFRLARSR